jgi:hypothetical protein
MFVFLLFVFLNISLISSSIQILKVPENVNVTITCHFDKIKSQLIPTNLSDNIILWYKDDTQVIGVNSISNNPKKYFLNQVNIHIYQLTIINVQLESSGLYKCQNFTAKEENHFQLNVIGKIKENICCIERVLSDTNFTPIVSHFSSTIQSSTSFIISNAC